MQQTALPELDPALPVTLEDKKERQRLHVRRSYYRKLNRMNEMREQVRVLKEQYALALTQRELCSDASASALVSSSSPTAKGGASKPKPKSPLTLYTQLARLKERLLEENAALQQMLATQNALGFRLHQVFNEFQDELLEHPSPEDSPYYLCPALTVRECQQLAWQSYEEAYRFTQSHAVVSTGATAFGWRDRRRIERDRLQFALQKTFRHMDAFSMALRSWALLTSGPEHATLYSSSLRVAIYIAQVVDANNVVAYRVFSTPDGQVVAKSLYLVSRFQVDAGYAILFRNVEKERLRERDDVDTSDPHRRSALQEHWLEDVFTWILFDEADGDCVLNFGGDIPGTMDYGKEVWMLEVLLIALRWEAKINGPLFTITST